jgi:hypothetical protein
MPEERTPLQDLERRALTGNRFAVVQVINALRGYRKASSQLLSARYIDVDEEDDDEAVKRFNESVQNIENDVEEPT